MPQFHSMLCNLLVLKSMILSHIYWHWLEEWHKKERNRAGFGFG